MKRMRLLALLCLTLFAVAATWAQTISASDARNHIGEKVTVCGKVASERTAAGSKGEPTFINLDAPYPHQIFTLVIWGEDRLAVGKLPEQGSRVCALGMIKEFRGVPEIKVWSRSQFLH